MRARRLAVLSFVGPLLFVASVQAQQVTAPVEYPLDRPAPPPTMILLTGHVLTATGEPRQGPVLLHLWLYAGREDTVPLWGEEQTVTVDARGAYSVFIGATQDGGVPASVFGGALARWVGVAVEGEPEQPRRLVLSAPYAANAAAADTLGGKTASDFVLSENLRAILRSWGVATTTGPIVGDGSGGNNSALTDWSGPSTPNAVVKWLDSQGTPGDSAITETGGNVGIGAPYPIGKLQLSNAGDVRLTLIPDCGANNRESLLDLWATFDNYPPDPAPRRTGRIQVGFDGGAWGTEYMAFGVAGAFDSSTPPIERLRITAAGNVGIGTSSPRAVGSGLDVTGSVSITNASNLGATDFTSSAWTGGGGGVIGWNKTNGWGELSLVSISGGGGDGGFAFYDRNSQLLRITKNGNVGIGTNDPVEKLHVVGHVKVTGDLSADGNLAAKYQDVAEWVDADEPLAPATVVTAHPTRNNQVLRSSRAYDTAVLGVVSIRPGILLGETAEGRIPIAQSGRVKVKVDARYGAIRRGDLLVTSPLPGYAMRSRPTRAGMHRPGTIIGKALEALPRGRGEILVLLTLQ